MCSRKRAAGIRRFIIASAETTSATALPVAQSPSASMRRMARSRLDAAVLRKEMSRAGRLRARPSSRSPRSSVMRSAAISLGTTTSAGRTSLRITPAIRWARWASSGP